MFTIDKATEAITELTEHYRRKHESVDGAAEKGRIDERIRHLELCREALNRLNPTLARDGDICPICLERLEERDYYCWNCGQCIARSENSG